jgi:hypothetical protein
MEIMFSFTTYRSVLPIGLSSVFIVASIMRFHSASSQPMGLRSDPASMPYHLAAFALSV